MVEDEGPRTDDGVQEIHEDEDEMGQDEELCIASLPLHVVIVVDA